MLTNGITDVRPALLHSGRGERVQEGLLGRPGGDGAPAQGGRRQARGVRGRAAGRRRRGAYCQGTVAIIIVIVFVVIE